MRSWSTADLDIEPRSPEILTSTDDARLIVVDLHAGESLDDHQVHERAFVIVLAGEVTATAADGTGVTGGPGLVIEFERRERHAVAARSDARFLLVLTPWPGPGHGEVLPLDRKTHVADQAHPG